MFNFAWTNQQWQQWRPKLHNTQCFTQTDCIKTIYWNESRLFHWKHVFRKCADTSHNTTWLTSASLWKEELQQRDIQWNPFSSTTLNTLFIEQMATVKELLDFCSIKESFLKFYFCPLLLPAGPFSWAFRLWIFSTSMQDRMVFSSSCCFILRCFFMTLFYDTVCYLGPLF